MNPSKRSIESTNLQEYLHQVEERQKKMEEDSMDLLLGLDKMEHQTEIMTIQIEKLQILKDQCFNILRQQQVGGANPSSHVQLNTNLEMYQPKDNYQMGEGRLSGLMSGFYDCNYKMENPRTASFLPTDNSAFPNISSANLMNRGMEHTTQPFTSSTSLNKSYSKIVDSNSRDSLLSKSLSSINQSHECAFEETRALHSTPFEDQSQDPSGNPLANLSVSSFNSDMLESTFKTAESSDMHARLAVQPDTIKDHFDEKHKEVDDHGHLGFRDECDVAKNDEMSETFAETEDLNSVGKTDDYILQTDVQDEMARTDLEMIAEHGSKASTVDESEHGEFQNETESMKQDSSLEAERKATESKYEGASGFSEQQLPRDTQSTMPPDESTAAHQSPPVDQRKSVFADSESSDISDHDIPITSSAAYQSLIGAAPVAQPQQKPPPISEESDSEDDVEKAMALAVKSAEPKREKPSSAESKLQESGTAAEKAPVIPKPSTDQHRKSIPSSAGNYKSKMSKATRKALGLDSDSDDFTQSKTQKSAAQDDDDEFDFFD